MAPKLYVLLMSPPCRAVLMVAKEIGLELDVEVVEREQLRNDEMIQLNPQHTVPILVDAEQDFTVWDSHAILIYLVGQYAKNDSLYPKNDIKKSALINQRMQFDSLLFEKFKVAFLPIMRGVQDEILDTARDELLEILGILEIFLQLDSFVAGDQITIADFTILALIASIEAAAFPIDPERFPKLIEWYNQLKELPYFEECNQPGLDRLKGLVQLEEPLI